MRIVLITKKNNIPVLEWFQPVASFDINIPDGPGLRFEISETFEQIAQEWQDGVLKMFPNSTAESCLVGLRREINEVLTEDNKEDKLKEYADCFIYLLSSCAYAGFNTNEIVKATQEKIQINLERKWKENPDGTYSHIKE